MNNKNETNNTQLVDEVFGDAKYESLYNQLTYIRSLLEDRGEVGFTTNKSMDSNGRIVIPKSVRNMIGVSSACDMSVSVVGDEIRLRRTT